jgi:hypothetical protein
MPKRLIDRLRTDSIHEFRAAARQRAVEGEFLAIAGHGLAAIYVWGYAAEMSLKASYFDSILFELRRPIERIDLRAAVARAATLGIAWPSPPNLHNLTAWSEVLIAERRSRGNSLPPWKAVRLLRASQRLFRLWREILRYRSNQAYSYEVEQVRHCVRLIMNYCDVL